MKFDFSIPMTFYEFLAIILAALALVIPLLKWAYNRFVKSIKFSFIPSGSITLYFNRSGAYITLGGVYESLNKPATVKNITAKAIRENDNATLSLNWSTFSSPVYRKVAGGFETSFETAHPFKVDADSLEPVFIEFANATKDLNEETGKMVNTISVAARPILSQQGVDLLWVDTHVKQLKEYQEAKLSFSDYFFWRAGSYMVSLITEYNNETLVNDFTFSLSEEESDKLRSNIDSLLVACIADHFMLSTTTSTVQKKYIEKSR